MTSNWRTSAEEGAGSFLVVFGVEKPEDGPLVSVGVLTPVLVPDDFERDFGSARGWGLGLSVD